MKLTILIHVKCEDRVTENLLGVTEMELKEIEGGTSREYKYVNVRKVCTLPNILKALNSKYGTTLKIIKVGDEYYPGFEEKAKTDKEKKILSLSWNKTVSEISKMSEEDLLQLTENRVARILIKDMSENIINWASVKLDSSAAEAIMEAENPVVEEEESIVDKEEESITMQEKTVDVTNEVAEEKLVKPEAKNERTFISEDTNEFGEDNLASEISKGVIISKDQVEKEFNMLQYSDVRVGMYIPVIAQNDNDLMSLRGLVFVTPSEPDEEDTEDKSGVGAILDFDSGMENKEYTCYNLYDLLTTGYMSVMNLGLTPKFEIVESTPKFNFDFNKSIRLNNYIERCSTKCIVICKRYNEVTMEDVAIALDESKDEMIKKLDLKNLCSAVTTSIKVDSTIEALDCRTLVIHDKVIESIRDHSSLELYRRYQKEVEELYGGLQINNKDFELGDYAVIPMETEEDKEFIFLPPITGLDLKNMFSLEDYGVQNLFKIFTGVQKQFKYGDSVEYVNIINQIGLMNMDRGMSAEECNKEAALLTGYVRGFEEVRDLDIQENELPLYRELVNYINSAIIYENNIKSKEELDRLISNGYESELASRILSKWCEVAFTFTRGYTGRACDLNTALILEYDSRVVTEAPEYFAYYNCERVGTGNTSTLNKKYEVPKTASGANIVPLEGYSLLCRYINTLSGTYKWAQVLIRLLRWGKRKPASLKLPVEYQMDQSIQFDFDNLTIVKDTGSKTTRDDLDSLRYLPKEILMDSSRVIEILRKAKYFKKYGKALMYGRTAEDNKDVEWASFITLLKSDAESENILQSRMDTLSFVAELWENDGIEYNGVKSGVIGLKVDRELGRIVKLPELQETYDASGTDMIWSRDLSIDSSSKRRGDRYRTYIGKEVKESRVLGESLTNIYSNRPVSKYMMDTAEFVNRTMYSGEANTRPVNPYECMLNLAMQRTLATKTVNAFNLYVSEQLCLPYIIADYAQRVYEEKYSREPKIGGKLDKLVQYLNCVLYGYLSTKKVEGEYKVQSMDVEDFVAGLRNQESKLEWRKDYFPMSLADNAKDDEEKEAIMFDRICKNPAKTFVLADMPYKDGTQSCKIEVRTTFVKLSEKKGDMCINAAFDLSHRMPSKDIAGNIIKKSETPFAVLRQSLTQRSYKLYFKDDNIRKIIEPLLGKE